MAGGGDTNKKGGKGAPKLKRAARDKGKYAAQYARTFKNKLRRVRKCNGEAAAQRYARTHSAKAVDHGPAKVALPKPGTSVKR